MTEQQIIRAALALSLGAEFIEVVLRLAKEVPVEKAHLIVRAAELYLKYQGA